MQKVTKKLSNDIIGCTQHGLDMNREQLANELLRKATLYEDLINFIQSIQQPTVKVVGL